ncbi:hypothetical protein [Lentzea sp. NPDC092896]|uniref:hypothetical protein n=1 Tax=Lentzea sp. NPDC092896 TaxID=3364127 RepID=UPI0038134380
MEREIKARIGDVDAAQDQIERSGGIGLGISSYHYTYFFQPPGHVLKLTSHEGEVHRTRMRRDGDTFIITEKTLIANPDNELESLGSRYGIKRVMHNRRTRYQLGDATVSINEISGLGIFLIVASDSPTIEQVRHLLGTESPNLVVDSFDDL